MAYLGCRVISITGRSCSTLLEGLDLTTGRQCPVRAAVVFSARSFRCRYAVLCPGTQRCEVRNKAATATAFCALSKRYILWLMFGLKGGVHGIIHHNPPTTRPTAFSPTPGEVPVEALRITSCRKNWSFSATHYLRARISITAASAKKSRCGPNAVTIGESSSE